MKKIDRNFWLQTVNHMIKSMKTGAFVIVSSVWIQKCHKTGYGVFSRFRRSYVFKMGMTAKVILIFLEKTFKNITCIIPILRLQNRNQVHFFDWRWFHFLSWLASKDFHCSFFCFHLYQKFPLFSVLLWHIQSFITFLFFLSQRHLFT